MLSMFTFDDPSPKATVDSVVAVLAVINHKAEPCNPCKINSQIFHNSDVRGPPAIVIFSRAHYNENTS